MNDSDFDAAVAEAVKAETADAKLGALVRLRKSVLKERRLLRAATIVSIILACVAIRVASRAGEEGHQVHEDLQEFLAQRHTAQVSACDGYNTDVVDKVNGILDSIADGSKNPAGAHAVLDPLRLTHRRCDQAGIDAYYDDDPTTDPFVKDGAP